MVHSNKMRSLVIIICFFIYASASPTKNVEARKEIEKMKTEDKNGDIILDISEGNEDDTAEGRDMLQGVKTETGGRKTIHIHSPNTPNINIMPTKYQISANNIPPPFIPSAFSPQGQVPNKDKDKRLNRRGDDDKKSKPKNQVNIYVYFPNSTNDDDMMNDSMMGMGMMGNRTALEKNKVPEKEPVKQILKGGVEVKPYADAKSNEDLKPYESGEAVPKTTKKPSYVLACPKGHVRVLGACVEYDQD